MPYDYAVITEYENRAYAESNERLGYTSSFYDEPVGNKTLEYEVGPHIDTALFNIYGNQDTAILALTNGDIDYLFNPLGRDILIQMMFSARAEFVLGLLAAVVTVTIGLL